MRVYQLHERSWARIVAQRVQNPGEINARLASRRRPNDLVPVDGHLVLIKCNHSVNPQTGKPVSRRELLDRILEALSVPEVDGVIASPDLLEELVLLNALERRLAFASFDPNRRPSPEAIEHFDGSAVSLGWDWMDSNDHGAVTLHAALESLAAQGQPTVIDLRVPEQNLAERSMAEWLAPIAQATSSLTTGGGVWLGLPLVTGLTHLAEVTGFPVLLSDTELPIAPQTFTDLLASALPLTVRGVAAGASMLFPFDESVAVATALIAGSVRRRAADQGG